MKNHIITTLLFVLLYLSDLNGENVLEPPEGIDTITIEQLVDNHELLLFKSSNQDILTIFLATKNEILKSICVRELAERGEKSLKLLEMKISNNDSTFEEKDLAAESLLYMDNENAKKLACNYYIQQLKNSNYSFKDYYHYPVSSRVGAVIRKKVSIDGNEKGLVFYPFGAFVPLLKLGKTALPKLIELLDEQSSMIIPMRAYWLIEEITKKKLPPFGEVWQNADILKKIVLDESKTASELKADDSNTNPKP